MVFRPISTSTWYDTKLTSNGSDSYLDLCMFGVSISSPNSCSFRLNAQLNLRILGFATRQTYMYVGSTCNRIQGCWVWQLTRLIYTWAQRAAEPKDVDFVSSPVIYVLGSSGSPDLYVIGLNTQLNPRMFGIEFCHIHIYLGSTLC